LQQGGGEEPRWTTEPSKAKAIEQLAVGTYVEQKLPMAALQ
jgi:hypothetical protein